METETFISVAAFTLLTALWLVFGLALITARSSLDAAWRGIVSLPLPLKGFIWLATLPVMAGLALWEGAWRTRSWPLVLRLVLVLGLALASLNAFLPKGVF